MQQRTTSSCRVTEPRFDPAAVDATWVGDLSPSLEYDEDELKAKALDSDIEALLRWRRAQPPVDYGELGWGD